MWGELIMNEIFIHFSLESPQQKNKNINIKVENKLNERLMYKFFIGCNGIWKLLREFDYNNSFLWTPKEDGKYTIMVQGKSENKKNGFDYIARSDFIIGKSEEKLIDSIQLNKHYFKVGEKLNIKVKGKSEMLLYRYWIRENFKWAIIKDYRPEESLSIPLVKGGNNEILVECKRVDSDKDYDDFARVQFKVDNLEKVEIKDFRFLSRELIAGEELVFQVEVTKEEDRIVLYKFVKIHEDGYKECIQDYSTKRMITYVENKVGNYKLMCYVKDMYSLEEFDDRAILNFTVRKYKEVKIREIITDKLSPQQINKKILLKPVVDGGEDLLYKYVICGPEEKNTGFITDNNFLWRPTLAGEYKIKLYVKDKSFKGEYEAKKEIDFEIHEIRTNIINIDKVEMDKGEKILIGDEITIKVKASGGINFRYSFSIKRDGVQEKNIKYSKDNSIIFTPEKCGEYEIEIRVKEKNSNNEYDAIKNINFKVYEFFHAEIQCILYPIKDFFICKDNIPIEVIATKGKDILIKYIIRINDQKVEETDYIKSFKYEVVPKCAGLYKIEIYAKNKKSKEKFDDKKEIKIMVKDSLPITNTKLKSSENYARVNEAITFIAESSGGKDKVYEFYVKEKDEWRKVQNYSNKNYYSFIPFSKGNYNVLVLCRSYHKKRAYEDYDMCKFVVE
ncbi:two component regulator three Y motif protein [Clostridium tetani]|nr:triple tyrosine motif-containing protein [Clostridium tetani]BDR76564.1 two component regulator three Y motif protein [Clostridium tetani]BDR87683.1 two component regulator three Y motif protein [Clostridium tetani]